MKDYSLRRYLEQVGADAGGFIRKLLESYAAIQPEFVMLLATSESKCVNDDPILMGKNFDPVFSSCSVRVADVDDASGFGLFQNSCEVLNVAGDWDCLE